VVTTKHSGIPELVTKNSGFIAIENDLIDLVKKLKKAIDNWPKLTEMCQNARKCVEKYFDLAKQIKVIEKIYSEVLNK
jgi:glycosyltransferase involved in cell wall biosynthesis